MNANELADEFELLLKEREEYPWGNFEILYDLTATMLRQQQAEIERLIGAEPITYGMLTVCKNCGQQNPYFEKAQDK